MVVQVQIQTARGGNEGRTCCEQVVRHLHVIGESQKALQHVNGSQGFNFTILHVVFV